MSEEHSPELIALGRCLEALRRGVHPDDLISKLFSEGILSFAQKGEASNYMLTNAKRTEIALGFVEGRVVSDGRVFHKLVRLLNHEPAYAYLAQRLLGKLTLHRYVLFIPI